MKRIQCKDLQNHLFYENRDWDKLSKMEIEPPYIPNTSHRGRINNESVVEEIIDTRFAFTYEDKIHVLQNTEDDPFNF